MQINLPRICNSTKCLTSLSKKIIQMPGCTQMNGSNGTVAVYKGLCLEFPSDHVIVIILPYTHS